VRGDEPGRDRPQGLITDPGLGEADLAGRCPSGRRCERRPGAGSAPPGRRCPRSAASR
jgi:hypothetical protein